MQKNAIAFLFVLSITLFTSLNAQIDIKFGVKAGANISTFLGTDAGSVKGLTGPHAGGIIRFGGSNDEGFLTYVIQSELFYSVNGGKEKTTRLR